MNLDDLGHVEPAENALAHWGEALKKNDIRVNECMPTVGMIKPKNFWIISKPTLLGYK